MKSKLSVSLLQPSMHWENVQANLLVFSRMLEGVPEGTDLVVLPETFSTGFTMNADLFAEEDVGDSVSWMIETARSKNLFLTGSLIIRKNGKIFNRLYWISPDGIDGHYDKRHLFRMGREDHYFEPGKERKVFTLGDFRFLPQICYDLRFPVFARNRNDYDVVCYVANWPAPRQPVWETLLRARAIENQAYVVGVSRVGKDGEGVDHLGGSCVFDPMGNIMGRLGTEEGRLDITIDLNKIREFREKFPVWKDADNFYLG